VICSACGYENQISHRFCGMCGMPLPHRALTALGAQGTHSFTRVPMQSVKPPDGPQFISPVQGRSELDPAGERGLFKERFRPDSMQGQSTSSAQPTEMVPEISLDEYVKSFRYAPPSEPEEVTMQGDAQVLQPSDGGMAEPHAANRDAMTFGMDEARTEISSSSNSDTADVAERLGLEDSEEHHQHSSLLDFTDAVSKPQDSATQRLTLAGPSFLGLADMPPVGAETSTVGATSRPPRSTSWTWYAGAALLVFAALGGLQWRSKVIHAKGPFDAISTRLQDMVKTSNQSPVQAERESGVKQSAIQAQQGPPTSSSQVPTEAETRGEPVKPDAGALIQPPADPQVAVKAGPGGDELAQAEDASDPATAVEWLWKATAKGNPRAPVMLANMYIKGEGVPRSCQHALTLLQTAAAKDNARACKRLAAMYNHGICVQPSRVEAYHWLLSALALDPNSQWAQQNRDLIWQQMTPDERAASQPSQ